VVVNRDLLYNVPISRADTEIRPLLEVIMQKRVFILVAVFMLMSAGCASEPTATVAPTPTPSPQEVASQAGAAMQALESLHFVFERDGAPAFVDAEQSLVFRRAEGDFAAPGRMRATVKILVAGFVAEVQVISVGEKQWMTNLLSGQWEEVPAGWGLDPAAFFDSQTGIPYLMAHGLTATKLEGPVEMEELEGSYWHLSGETAGEQVASMSGGLIPPGQVEVEAWIDPATYLIHRVHLLLPESDPEEPMEWVIEFGAFDEPVEIEAP